MNNRKEIRDALKTMLTGNTAAGANVYSHRATSMWRSELPAILISASEEQARKESLNGRRYIRTLTLNVEVRVEDSTAAEDTVDDILAEIEDIVADDPSIGGKVLSTVLISSELRNDADAEKEIGVGVLTFESQYIG